MRLTQLFLPWILLMLSGTTVCQSTYEIAGAAHGALSNTGIARSSVWQNFINPAGILNDTSSFQLGVAYTNKFNLAELSSRDFVASKNFRNSAFGLTIHSFGYVAYTQNQFSGAYATKLSNQLRVAAQLNFFSLRIAEGYGNFWALTANIGFQYDFNHKISIGVVIKNPNRSQLSSEIQAYVRSSIGAGISYHIADNLTLFSDLSKDLDFDPDFRFGLEYQPIESWSIRGGLSTLNHGLSFGFGYGSSKWSVDLASIYHQFLGFSPMISFTYRND